MRIAIASDVHLEFGDLILKNEENADVLILSGDICVAADFRKSDSYGIIGKGKSERYIDFFSRCAFEFPKVLYIAGNHEHYHGDYAETFTILRNFLGHIQNLHILDKENVTIDGVTFICGTLWTDMNKEDGITLMHMKSMMNDFRCITNGARETHYKDTVGNAHVRIARFTPDDAVEDHKKMLEYIKIMVESRHDQKIVVVGLLNIVPIPIKTIEPKSLTDKRLLNMTYKNFGKPRLR